MVIAWRKANQRLVVVCLVTAPQNLVLKYLSTMNKSPPLYTKDEKIKLIVKHALWLIPFVIFMQFWGFQYIEDYSTNTYCKNIWFFYWVICSLLRFIYWLTSFICSCLFLLYGSQVFKNN